MEAEYVVVITSLKQLIPFKRLVGYVWNAVGLKQDKFISINTAVWEDNQGCKILATLEPPRMIPRSKHYAINTIGFVPNLNPITLLSKVLILLNNWPICSLKVYIVFYLKLAALNLWVGSLLNISCDFISWKMVR